MIYVDNLRTADQQKFLDDEVDFAIQYFKQLVRKENASYVVIEWVKNTAVLLPDRGDPEPLDTWGT